MGRFDTTAPTLAATDIVDDRSGADVDIGTTVIYTVTFSEDMDDTTVTAADFGNAGTSSVSISTVGEVVFVITPNGSFNEIVATIPASAAAGSGHLFSRLAAEP